MEQCYVCGAYGFSICLECGRPVCEQHSRLMVAKQSEQTGPVCHACRIMLVPAKYRLYGQPASPSYALHRCKGRCGHLWMDRRTATECPVCGSTDIEMPTGSELQRWTAAFRKAVTEGDDYEVQV